MKFKVGDIVIIEHFDKLKEKISDVGLNSNMKVYADEKTKHTIEHVGKNIETRNPIYYIKNWWYEERWLKASKNNNLGDW